MKTKTERLVINVRHCEYEVIRTVGKTLNYRIQNKEKND